MTTYNIKGNTVIIKADNKKMTKEELEGYLKMRSSGAGMTKNAKKYQRKAKHHKPYD